MLATTVLRAAALCAPHSSIKPAIKNTLVYLKTHCNSIMFTPHFSPKLLKCNSFVLDSVCFASSGETTETEQVEEEIQDNLFEVSTYICNTPMNYLHK